MIRPSALLLLAGLALLTPAVVRGDDGQEAQQALLTPAAIDAAIERALAEADLEPAPVADDATFLRRVTLDAVGRLPTPAEQRAFAQDRRPDKRQRRIEALLAEPGFAQSRAHALRLRLLVRLDQDRDAAGYGRLLEDWLAREIEAGRGWDELAADLLAAEGTSGDDPRLTWVVDRGAQAVAEDLAGSAARQFLGLQLECARCHDHPFDDFTQADFHGLAAYFARTRIRQVPGRQAVFRVSEAPVGEHRLAGVPGKVHTVAPAVLAGEPSAGAGGELRPGPVPSGITRTSRRAALSRWLTSPDNPWFARAAVNRAWAELLGAGLVDPVDDLSTGVGEHLELLEQLAQGFQAHDFDLRALYRAILGSRAYQRGASLPGPPSSARAKRLAATRTLFGAARVRPLDAARLTQALLQVAGRAQPQPGEPEFVRRALLRRLGDELEQALPSEDEPADASSVTSVQGLVLLNGRTVSALVAGASLTRLLEEHERPAERVRALYHLTLCRAPSGRERRAALAYVKGGEREAYADLLWALVAGSEFLSNH